MKKILFQPTIYSINRSFWLVGIVILATSITISLCGWSEKMQISSETPKKTRISDLINEPTEKNVDIYSESNEAIPVIFGKKGEYLFHNIIVEASIRHQVDPLLIKAIIMAESSYNPNAISKVGARGLMQLMPRTAEELGVEDCFDPTENIDGGVRYLKKLLVRFNWDIELALAAYNAGSRRVRECQGIPQIEATQDYIKKVCHYYQKYKDKHSLEDKGVDTCMKVPSHMI